MTLATVTADWSELCPRGVMGFTLTTTGTTSTFESPFYDTIIAIANNRSDDDGVGIGVETAPGTGRTQTITITVGSSGDVIDLLIVGRK